MLKQSIYLCFSLHLHEKYIPMDIDTLNGLKRCPLFQGFTAEDIMSLMHAVRYRVVRYAKGEIFAIAGDPCLHIDIVVKGEMIAKVASPFGHSVRMSLHHSGNMLAPAFLYAKNNVYPVTVEASTEAYVFRLMPDDLENLFSVEPRLYLNFIKVISNIVAHLTKRVSMLSMSVKERLCFYLQEEIVRQGTTDLMLTLSRQEMAESFGVQKYSLQRCLNELKQEGIIDYDGRHIKVLKPSGLT